MSEAPEFNQEKQVILGDVLVSLELDGLVPSSEDAKQAIAGAVAETMMEVSLILDVPIPKPTLLFDWSSSEYLLGKGDEDKRKVPADFISPGSGFDPETDTYNIRINPILLRETASVIDSGKDATLMLDNIRVLVSHEMYHEYQADRFPKSYRLHHNYDGACLSRELWLRSRLERGAVLFSREYMKNRQTSSLKEWKSRRKHITNLNGLIREMITAGKKPINGSGD
jgi:hypothetical protein